MIYVAPLNNPIPGAVPFITERLPSIFATSVATYRPSFDPAIAFDENRRQYNSTLLLAELLGDLPAPNAKVIGITNVDLFIPVLTFVFGEAQLNGSVAVASTFRLRNSFYGLPDDPDLLLERLEKEVVHELGHVFNLTHCDYYNCVMHASTNVEDVDVKSVAFCSACRKALQTGSP